MDFNTGTIQITLQIWLYYSKHKVFKSPSKSSFQVRTDLRSIIPIPQFLNSTPLSPISYRGSLAIPARLTQTPFRIFITTRHGPQQKTQSRRELTENTYLHHFFYDCVTSPRTPKLRSFQSNGPCTDHSQHCFYIFGRVCFGLCLSVDLNVTIFLDYSTNKHISICISTCKPP
jgi:hypothetical protein